MNPKLQLAEYAIATGDLNLLWIAAKQYLKDLWPTRPSKIDRYYVRKQLLIYTMGKTQAVRQDALFRIVSHCEGVLECPYTTQIFDNPLEYWQEQVIRDFAVRI